MKRFGKIAVCLAGGLALNAGLRADGVVLPDNPYAQIVTRNVFDLNPLPKLDPLAGQEANPPPKITPNGIMDVFGHLQVLFKAADPGKPGQPPKDNSYILGEGERQDDIEVVKIDEKAGLVTFNNHGTVQELSLASESASSAPTAVSPNIPGSRPNGNQFGHPGNFGGNGGNFGGLNRGDPNSGNNFNGSPVGAVPTGGNYSTQTQEPRLSPEAQVLMIEAERMQYQSENNPIAKILPPTVLTPGNGGGGDSQTMP